MSVTRNNHYVPQWYQEGFLEPNENTLAYLNMKPEEKILPDGRTITPRTFFKSPTSRAFFQTDLYSTFFGTSVNDEIEKKLFGDIDVRGSHAVRAFWNDDKTKWHQHFQALFEYIDAQKLRTPKGLDWLRLQYPGLDQNELMIEMQGLRFMNCAIWAEGVREIVSAEDANVKFIISDHPVTIYNPSAQPELRDWMYPTDPSITLLGSQTIFPLSRNLCLILTNLEFTESKSSDPLQKRTFARNFRSSMVKTDGFITGRKLTDVEVRHINYVIKHRAKRYIAAGQKEWLYPEKAISCSWQDVGSVLLPSSNKLFGVGGELFVQYNDGRVHYQDAYGRTEKPQKFLQKQIDESFNHDDYCGCGSGFTFKDCCQFRATPLRPSWSEVSIRERNLMFLHAISDVLELDSKKDWTQLRRQISDDKISEIYALYAQLWPLETDILSLLPKPDGLPRAVYTGLIHPQSITDHAVSLPIFFGETLIAHPFTLASSMKPDFSPVKHPEKYRHDILKSLMLFLQLMPLVEQGLINLVPDPCDFNPHLRDQIITMAESRRRFLHADLSEEPKVEQIMMEDVRRSMLALPDKALRHIFSGDEKGDLSEEQLLVAARNMQRDDQLSSLQRKSLGGENAGGEFIKLKLAPNFEMSMYLAQATGASIVTDNKSRWQEIQLAIARQSVLDNRYANSLANSMETSTFTCLHHYQSVETIAYGQQARCYVDFMKSFSRYVIKSIKGSRKPNFEAGLRARFIKAHSALRDEICKLEHPCTNAKVTVAFPEGGIRDNTVNRLLLMSNSEMHLQSVPMAFFFQSIK